MGSTTLKSSHSSPSTRTSSSITPPANTHLPTLDNSRPLINSRPQKPSIPIYPIHPLRVFLHHYLGHTQHLPLSQCPTPPSVAAAYDRHHHFIPQSLQSGVPRSLQSL